MQKYLRLGLLVFAFYHITAILLMPNPYSILSREVGWIFTPYANTLGLNTTWQFFSPEPSAYVYYPYEIQVQGGEAVSGRWPPVASDVPHMLLENYRRLVYHSRYTTSAPERVEKFLVPFLCRRVPNALSVVVNTTVEEIPPIEKARLEGKTFEGMKQEVQAVQMEFQCQN